MGLSSTLGSPALGSCPGKMSPRTFVSEGQQGLVLGLQFQRTVGKRNPTLTGRTQNLMLQDPGQKHQWVNTSLRTSAALQSAVVGPSPPTNRPAWALAHLALLPTRGPTPALRHCGPIGQPPGVWSLPPVGQHKAWDTPDPVASCVRKWPCLPADPHELQDPQGPAARALGTGSAHQWASKSPSNPRPSATPPAGQHQFWNPWALQSETTGPSATCQCVDTRPRTQLHPLMGGSSTATLGPDLANQQVDSSPRKTTAPELPCQDPANTPAAVPGPHLRAPAPSPAHQQVSSGTPWAPQPAVLESIPTPSRPIPPPEDLGLLSELCQTWPAHHSPRTSHVGTGPTYQ